MCAVPLQLDGVDARNKVIGKLSREFRAERVVIDGCGCGQLVRAQAVVLGGDSEWTAKQVKQ